MIVDIDMFPEEDEVIVFSDFYYDYDNWDAQVRRLLKLEVLIL